MYSVPCWVAQLVGSSSHTPKYCCFNPWSGHIPRLQVQSPVRVYTGATYLTWIFLSFFLSLLPLPLYLKSTTTRTYTIYPWDIFLDKDKKRTYSNHSQTLTSEKQISMKSIAYSYKYFNSICTNDLLQFNFQCFMSPGKVKVLFGSYL